MPRLAGNYVALTTHGSGWWVICVGEPGETKEEVEGRAKGLLEAVYGPPSTDMVADTVFKNLNIVSKTSAQRGFPKAWAHYEYAFRAAIPY